MKKKILFFSAAFILLLSMSVVAGEISPGEINPEEITVISSESEEYRALSENDFNIIGFANLGADTDILQDILLRYDIQPGDSLYRIARRSSSTVEELKRINNLSRDWLLAEQELLIPRRTGESSDENVYYVQPGDSLYRIASKFGITVSELRRINNIQSNMLYAGQKINLPGSGQIEDESEEKMGKLIYYVEPGDTLYDISARFDVSISEIREENDLNNSYLDPGQMLYIPAEVEETRIVYFVKPGDYLYRIAERFDTGLETIRNINDLGSDYLNIGQKLLLPEPDYEGEEYNLELSYRVEAGDTLARIARRYDLSAWELRQHNGINSVRTGQTITIPLSVPEGEMDRRHRDDYNPGPEEMDLLARAVYSEARGESFRGQVAVAGVVLNRISSSLFPNSARGVIFQPWQFEAVHDGQIWLEPKQQSRLAVEAALEGWDPSQGALYYYNPDTAQSDWVFHREVIVEIGDHYFALTV